MKIKLLKISLLTLFLSLVLSGCSFVFPWEKKGVSVVPDSTNESNTTEANMATATEDVIWTGDLRKFANEDSLRNFLKEPLVNNGESTGNISVDSNYSLGTDLVSLSPINIEALDFADADIVKVDGSYIYALVRNDLHIIDITTITDAKEVNKISFTSRPEGLLVLDGSLVVFGRDTVFEETSLYNSFNRDVVYNFLKVFNVSDPSRPELIKDLSFEGSRLSVRLSGNYVYFLGAMPVYNKIGESITPKVISQGAVVKGECQLNKGCLNDEVYYFDAPYNSHILLSVTAINIFDQAESLKGQSYLVDGNYNFSLSAAGNLYLMRSNSMSAYEIYQEIKKEKVLTKLSEADQLKIKEIEDAPVFILKNNEKNVKISDIINNHIQSLTKEEQDDLQGQVESSLLNKVKQKSKELDITNIYKFLLKVGRADYQAKGQIYGKILPQNSLVEYSGTLRLMTVRSQLWSLLFESKEKIYSNVYVLDSNLQTLGVLENISTDYNPGAVAFIGDRAYVSTINPDAPLYVLDLVDQAKPAILGAIKTSLYNNIYSLDDKGEKLLGFSRDVSSGSGDNGLKLSIFDFTDLQEPKELSSYSIGGGSSNSIALSDYRALSYLKEKDIVSLPVTVNEDNKLAFSGALIFTAVNGELARQEEIDHSAGGRFIQPDYDSGFNIYDNTVRRSFIANNYLFTFSNKYLKIHNPVDLVEIKSIILTPSEEDAEVSSVLLETQPEPQPEPEIGLDPLIPPVLP